MEKEQGCCEMCGSDLAEVAALRAQVSALQTEAKHWKDQHANEVKRARIIKAKGDLPLQRIRAYEYMGELQGQVERLTEEKDEAKGEAEMWRSRIEAITSIIGDARGLLPADGKALMYNYECVKFERDQLRAEVERLKNELVMRDGYIICHEEGQK